jgi:hypothetical protein
MSRSMIRTTIGRAGLLGLAFTLSGCSAGYTTKDTSQVLLLVAGITPSPLQSDVLKGGGIQSDNATLAIAVRFKNPNIETVPSIPSAVNIERYEIRYRRSDGRGVEGQDVPFPISGNLTSGYDVKTSGTDPLLLEVVRAQAKLEPPLRNLRGASGGAIIVTMFADITLHGRTISGQVVSASSSLQVDFSDWADQ